MDGDTASQSSKKSPDVEESGKMSFLEEDEGVILKKNPILQTHRNLAKEKFREIQRKVERG